MRLTMFTLGEIHLCHNSGWEVGAHALEDEPPLYSVVGHRAACLSLCKARLGFLHQPLCTDRLVRHAGSRSRGWNTKVILFDQLWVFLSIVLALHPVSPIVEDRDY